MKIESLMESRKEPLRYGEDLISNIYDRHAANNNIFFDTQATYFQPVRIVDRGKFINIFKIFIVYQ